MGFPFLVVKGGEEGGGLAVDGRLSGLVEAGGCSGWLGGLGGGSWGVGEDQLRGLEAVNLGSVESSGSDVTERWKP